MWGFTNPLNFSPAAFPQLVTPTVKFSQLTLILEEEEEEEEEEKKKKKKGGEEEQVRRELGKTKFSGPIPAYRSELSKQKVYLLHGHPLVDTGRGNRVMKHRKCHLARDWHFVTGSFIGRSGFIFMA